MKTRRPLLRTAQVLVIPPLFAVLLGVLAMGTLLLGAQPAAANAVPQENICMQTNYTNHGHTQTLGCTANDVRVARATNIDIVSGGECHLENGVKKCTCNQDQSVTFTADYEVVLTAQTRYDIGIYFGTDGDPNGDGALTGACKLSVIDDVNNTTNFVNRDPAPDVCGDINAAHNPQILTLTLTTLCQAGDDGKLKLPNCTSWRQSGSNEVCDDATDAFPGSPSKCNCQPGFTVNIFVETATLEVTKTALDPTVPETGGSVTYSVAVKNLAQQASVTLDTLTDNLYGDITTDGHNGITSTDCTLATIAAGATYTCMFTVLLEAGDSGQTITDTVTACGTDSFGHTGLCDDDDAVVTYADVSTEPSLSKAAVAAAVQVDVTYNVVVTNNSTVDTLTVTSLTDDKFGDITTAHDAGGGFEQVVDTNCATGGTIAPLGNYPCSFVGRIIGTGSHVNTVTGGMTDDDGVGYTPSDDATVSVPDVIFP